MSDLFHSDIPEQFIRDVFTVMLRADQHVYQVLTKRPSRAARFLERNAHLLTAGRLPSTQAATPAPAAHTMQSA